MAKKYRAPAICKNAHCISHKKPEEDGKEESYVAALRPYQFNFMLLGPEDISSRVGRSA